MGCSTLQSCPSEPCLPVPSHQVSAQAVHTSIPPLHWDTPQAGPCTCKLIPQYKGTTHCLYPSPLHTHPVEKAGSTELLPRSNYTDDHCTNGDAPLQLNFVFCACLPLTFSLRLMSTKCQILKANKISLI